MPSQKRAIIIQFDAGAPGGQDIVENALRAIGTDRPFELPLHWKLTAVRAVTKVGLRRKLLTLTYLGDEFADAAISKPPEPPDLSVAEEIPE